MPDLTMRERISTLEEVINGNGKEGLKTEIALIKKEQKTMNESLEKMATAYSALANSHVEQDAIERHKEKNKEHRVKAITTVSIVLGIVTGSVATLYLILDHIG